MPLSIVELEMRSRICKIDHEDKSLKAYFKYQVWMQILASEFSKIQCLQLPHFVPILKFVALNFWYLPKTRWTHDALTRSGPPHVFHVLLYTQVVVFQNMLLLLEGFVSVLMWDWASQIKGWSLDLSTCEKYVSDVLQRTVCLHWDCPQGPWDPELCFHVSVIPWQKGPFFYQDCFNYCKNHAFKSS